MNIKWSSSLMLIPVIALTGCYHNFGPESLKRTYPSYSQGLTQVWNEQFLLNLVRIRYGELPCFLDVTTIISEQTFSSGLNWSAEVDSASNKTLNKPGLSISTSQTPKLTYVPLQGQEFIKRFLTPIPPTIALALTQNGWKIDRIFNLCVDRINNLNNAPTASGQTPNSAPDYKDFARFTNLLRKLQKKDLILIGKYPKDFPSLFIRLADDKELSKEINEVKELLNIAPDLQDFKIADNFLEMKDDRLTIRFRSLLGIMNFLSQSVEVPPLHKKNKVAHMTQNPDGTEFNWAPLTGKFLKVHCQSDRPRDAFLAVQYRKQWYYISDDDYHSKSTLVLMYTLFNLQTSKLKPKEPVLTLSL